MNVGFVGMGNMGQMLVGALARSGSLSPGEIYISNRSAVKLARVTESVPGVNVAYNNSELAQRCETVFLCIKPGETRAALQEMESYITPEHLLVAITNTIDIPVLEKAVKARVAKVIPSLVQAVGAGASLLMFGERCTAEDKALLHRLFGTISRTYTIRESQARVCSDLTSCGPAFISYALRSLSRAARHYQPDLSAETLDAMIRHTAAGTLKLMEQVGYSFDDVIAKVSTPGGITADGIAELDEHMAGVWEQVIETTLIKEEAKRAKVEL